MAVSEFKGAVLEVFDPSLWCTREEAKTILGRSDHALYRRVSRGELRAVKFGHRVFYRRSEIEQMKERQGFLYGGKG